MKKIAFEEIVVILAALLTLVVGVVADIQTGDHSMAFQRSGSVVVCIGIIFAYFDIGGVYEGKFDEELNKLRAKRMERDIVFSEEELEREVRGSTNYFISRARSVHGNNKKRVALIDMLVLIIGTLVWGFGDLVI